MLVSSPLGKPRLTPSTAATAASPSPNTRRKSSQRTADLPPTSMRREVISAAAPPGYG